MDNIRKLLGQEPIDLVLDFAKAGRMNQEKLCEIGRQLGAGVLGRHKLRRERGRVEDYEVEMRHMFEDWYQEESYGMTSEEAQQKLIGIFQHRDVSLEDVAERFQKIINLPEEKRSDYRMSLQGKFHSSLICSLYLHPVMFKYPIIAALYYIFGLTS